MVIMENLKFGVNNIKLGLNNMAKDIADKLKFFALKMSEQGKETEVAAVIIQKHIKGESISPNEELQLKQTIFDILKIAGIGIPFVLIPGASVLLSALIIIAKKHNINLLPSVFTDKQDETNN